MGKNRHRRPEREEASEVGRVFMKHVAFHVPARTISRQGRILHWKVLVLFFFHLSSGNSTVAFWGVGVGAGNP